MSHRIGQGIGGITVCEHLLFVFFVSGVTSALPKRKLR